MGTVTRLTHFNCGGSARGKSTKNVLTKWLRAGLKESLDAQARPEGAVSEACR